MTKMRFFFTLPRYLVTWPLFRAQGLGEGEERGFGILRCNSDSRALRVGLQHGTDLFRHVHVLGEDAKAILLCRVN